MSNHNRKMISIIFSTHPKFNPSSENAVDIGKTNTEIIASYNGMGAKSRISARQDKKVSRKS